MKTIEDNKLIAEFMGLLKSRDAYYRKEFNSGDWCEPEELRYHESWDWLMPVVSKCIHEFPEMDEHTKLFQNLDTALWSVDISEVYKAVVEFIKWYNKQK